MRVSVDDVIPDSGSVKSVRARAHAPVVLVDVTPPGRAPVPLAVSAPPLGAVVSTLTVVLTDEELPTLSVPVSVKR